MTRQAVSPEEESHRALLRRVAQQDHEAFAEIYRAYEGRVFRFIQKKLNDPFEAADVLHNVFLDVWRTAANFGEKSRVSTWLLGIAFNKTMDRLRKKSPVTDLDDGEGREVASDDPSALDLIEVAEEAAEVRHCLDKLSAEQRTVVELAFYQELSYADIAQVIGRPEGTVKTRVFHAKQSLKRCLARRLRRSA